MAGAGNLAQALIRKLKDETLNDYRSVAKARGTSLEAELRQVIERNKPKPAKDKAYLLALARELQSRTLKPGVDSTPYIRWMRDTNAGRIPGSPAFEDYDGGD